MRVHEFAQRGYPVGHVGDIGEDTDAIFRQPGDNPSFKPMQLDMSAELAEHVVEGEHDDAVIAQAVERCLRSPAGVKFAN